MRTSTSNIFQNIDWLLIGLYLLMMLLGWINIYAAVYNEEHASIFDLTQSYGKQLLWIVAALFIALLILAIDEKFFSTFAWPIYGFFIVLLAGVLVVGKEVGGAKAWYQIGGFALQPTEFAKFATNLVVAKYLSTMNIKMADLKTKINMGLILLLPLALIMLQPDTGSALVYLGFIFVMYREGLSGNILAVGLIAVILFSFTILSNEWVVISIIAGITGVMYFFVRKYKKDVIKLFVFFALAVAFVFSIDYAFNNILAKHQRQRIEVLYGKEVDLKGVGYNVHQSKIAIGSGGFWGKGFLQGTQTKYDFVPEQSTDFIFCTVGEEWGFVGSSLVVILFVGLISRIVYVAERQRAPFSRIYGYGLASIIFLHFLINIGMTIGVAPVIGIPLPFFSYGGSSLWGFTILLFIFIRQDAHRLNLL